MATPFVESNVQAMKVKQMQHELKEMETKAVDLNTSEGNPSERGSVPHFIIRSITTSSSGLIQF